MKIHLNEAKRFERIREQMSAAGIEVIEDNVGRPGMGMFVAEAAGIEMTYLAYRSLAARRIESGCLPALHPRRASKSRLRAAGFLALPLRPTAPPGPGLSAPLLGAETFATLL
jgi:hypothetical protein